MDLRRTRPIAVALSLAVLLLGGGTAWATTCPTSGANVTISAGCTFDAGTYTFTGTLTIASGVTVTMASDVGGAVVSLVADDINVQSGAIVDGNARGYGTNSGTGGATTTYQGASYGGYGGGSAPPPYGSLTAPTDLGSGGYNSGQSAYGHGGGAIKLTATGTLTVNGTIRANGGNAYSSSVYSGGTGGSIWLVAGTLAGAGTITANAGTSSNSNSAATSSGGRVAIEYTTNASSLFTANRIQAYAGDVGGLMGGAGTVFLRQLGTNGHLVVDNGNRAASLGRYDTVPLASATFDDLTIRNGGRLRLLSGQTLAVAPGGTFTGGGSVQPLLNVAAGSTFAAPSANQVVDGIDVYLYGTFGTTTHLTVTDSTFIHGGTFAAGLVTLTLGSGSWFTRAGTAQMSLTTLTVQSGGTLSHLGNGATLAHRLDVVATTIDVQAGGSINVTAQGFATNSGTGGATTTYQGASHGAYGGGSAPTPYGSLTSPIDLGSGGYNSGQSDWGHGGGAVKLTVSGTLTVNGTIQANGGNAYASSVYSGGTGGSVWLVVGTLAGAGAITANAGTSSNSGSAATSSGGRVAVEYATNTSSLLTPGKIQAYAGDVGGLMGGAGTIFVRQGTANGDLIVDNGNRAASVARYDTVPLASGTFDNLTIRNGGRLRLLSGQTVAVAPGGSFTGGGSVQPLLNIAAGSTFVAPSATQTVDAMDIHLFGTFGTTTSLTVTDSTFIHGGTFSAGLATLTLGSGSWFTRAGTAQFNLTTLTVQSGGTLSHLGNDTALAHRLDVVATTVDVQAGGNINVSAQGFTANSGTGGATTSYQGASYGAYGGGSAATPYGSLTSPTDLGSGGYNSSQTAYGHGGGAVKLTVSGTLTVNGTIQSNGGDCAASSVYSGGTGGSIWLTAGTLAGAGAITANGGASTNTSSSASSSGGRIAIAYTTNGSSLFTPGKIQAYAGNVAGHMGGAGTIYLRQGATHGDLLVDNGNRAATQARYDTIPLASATFDNLTIRNGGRLRLLSGQTVTVASGGAVTGGGSVQPLLNVAAGATFVAPNATQVVNAIDVYLYGTFGTTTDLTVTNSTFIHGGTFSAGLASLTLGSGSWFTRSGTAPVNVGAVTIQSGGTLSHLGNGTTVAHRLDVVATSFDLQSGGNVNVSLQGYTTNSGPGGGTGTYQGASHGGYGGNSSLIPYGDLDAPTALGSGGYNSGQSDWGHGGGAVKLTVSGTLTVNGTIQANGGNSYASSVYSGGTGGSIWLIAGTLAGGGTITANGGASSNSSSAGTSSGGRVAIQYTTDTSTLLSTVGKVQAYPGTTGSAVGGAGTIRLRPSGADGDLIIDANGLAANITPQLPTSLTLDALVVRRGGHYLLWSGRVGDVGTLGGHASHGTLTVNAGATLILPVVASMNQLDLEVWGELAGVANWSVYNGTWSHGPSVPTVFQDVHVGTGGVFQAVGLNALEVNGTFEVADGGTATHAWNDASRTHILNVSAYDITVAGGGAMNVDGRGYSALNGPGHGVGGSGYQRGGGAGHGGAGGAGAGSSAGAGGGTYDSAATPNDLGSGGGSDGASVPGGAGGGQIVLTACGTLSVAGVLTANGTNGTGSQAGGGSGGSIRFDAGTVTGSGTIRAIGGNGVGSSNNSGGGGGGGRIAGSWVTTTYGGAVSVAGGTSPTTSSNGASGSYSPVTRTDPVCTATACGSGACAGTWDSQAGACDYSATEGASCEDGDLCTVDEVCASGTCGGGSPDPCDDGDPCTGTLCDSQAGCQYDALTGVACDDGDACTTNDACASGLCQDTDAVTCDDGDDCTNDACNPSSGCDYPALSGTACEDGDLCTGGDTCSAGACVPGGPADCDDDNDCTDDACVSPTGCTHTGTSGGACDDESLCTTDDVCAAGVCGGTAVTCDDGDACTSDGCDAATGACEFTYLDTGANDGCDGVDDDCDGQTDEDYAGDATSCGVGACAATGTTACIDGGVVDGCTPGAPGQELCGDGVDSDCDGQDSNGFMDPCGGDTAIYLGVRDAAGVLRYTARCTQPAGGGAVTCETEADGVHLKLYDGLLCPGGSP